MDIKVFYAWQSDRPSEINKDFIYNAALDACKQISDDSSNDFVLELVQDIEGHPGMCDIPKIILEKIKNCNIFLSDLTLVGKTQPKEDDRKPRSISNPNVIFELGYNVGSKVSNESDGFERVVAVMNTAYGEPDEQMFDINHRVLIKYNLQENSDKSEIDRTQKKLTDDIKDALITILRQVVFPERGKTAIDRFNEIRTQFESSVREGKFHGLSHSPGMIAITIVPDKNVQLKYEDIEKRKFLPFGSNQWRQEPCGKSVLYVWETPKSDHSHSERLSIAEVNQEGIVLAADSFFIIKNNSQSKGNNLYIPNLYEYENLVIKSIHDYVMELHQMDIKPSWKIGISLLEVDGCRILPQPRDRQDWEIRGLRNLCMKNDIITDCVEICNINQVDSLHKTAIFLKSTFDDILREFGFPYSPNLYENGN